MTQKLGTSFFQLSMQLRTILNYLGETELSVKLTEDLKETEERLRSVVTELNTVADSIPYFDRTPLTSDIHPLCDHGWGD